ncbi:hypothetical protein COEREDRAFT_81157 [Coemansia reversa NRRL 1564]|uniref:Ima1 N-terminal domain-containing protein n=1 Tax=Coemansia reversa (strain ATCC 12441 / NRRL 1564) TaxID=763665 RepID=A0A2G5BBU2_COERN|nr:hypothetical protein COEREDRAFT_81157 [Coemansia reversa NRRL 1564]|eukprot:PIA16483.1 hypothetical protein COEREDRAFT_81157 [Coemansia reversa NRRL 1564]
MWTALFGGRTTVKCWFCNQKTRLPRSRADHDTKHDWHCHNCDNQNTLDVQGNLVDARAEMYRESPISRRPGLPTHRTENSNPLFCSSCQRNQELVCQILSGYLPDEDDYEYQSRFERADEYAQSLKRRYPMVCRACQIKVDERLRTQAQWMYRRELGSALHRSESARKLAPRILPTLRRKRMVVAWILCAAVAIITCFLCTWVWYCFLFAGYLIPGPTAIGIGLALALLSYISRLLNPLWLYIAYHPGIRVAGLPQYRQRVVRISLLRCIAAVMQRFIWNSTVWVVVLICDLGLCWSAMRCIHTHDGRRPVSRQSIKAMDQQREENSTIDGGDDALNTRATGQDAQLALSSLKSLSFDASEVNADQDDTLFGSAFSSALDGQWERPLLATNRRVRSYMAGADSSDEERSTVHTDILSDMGTLSFGNGGHRELPQDANNIDDELAALMGGGNSGQGRSRNIGNSIHSSGSLFRKPETKSLSGKGTNIPGPQGFEPFAFRRNVSTGLEAKMSAFSLEDDGSYQGLFGSTAMDSRLLDTFQRLASPGAIVGGCVLVSWLSGEHMPLLLVWIVRLMLVGVTFASVAYTTATPILRCICGYTLVLGLVAIPAFYTLDSTNDHIWSYTTTPKTSFILDTLDHIIPNPMLTQWPLAKQSMSHFIRLNNNPSRHYIDDEYEYDHAIDADLTMDPIAAAPDFTIPRLIQIDCGIELVSLAFLAFF